MKVTRRVAEPKPSTSEQRALEHLLSGQGNPTDAETVRLLVDRCGRYGCIYTRPSKTSPGMKECPGWCEALELYDRQCAMRTATKSGDTKSKTGKLARNEQEATQALERGEASTEDVLTLILLAKKCAKDGCASTGNSEALCPGWCAIARKSWDVWWSR